MAYVSPDARMIADVLSTPTAKTERKSVWRNMLEALMESRRKAAEREIARYIALNGGMLTDAIDRDIETKFVFPQR